MNKEQLDIIINFITERSCGRVCFFCVNYGNSRGVEPCKYCRTVKEDSVTFKSFEPHKAAEIIQTHHAMSWGFML